jgi:putative ABC transport system permease protein
VWLITLRDLQWRSRRFAIAVVATALVMALALLLAGVSASFDNEIGRTVRAFRADAWLVAGGSFGPFTGPVAFAADRAEAIRREPGVERADPVAILAATTTTPEKRNVNVLGIVPGGAGAPPDSEALGPGAAIVDDSFRLEPGDRVVLNGSSFRIAGLVHGLTYFAGVPTAIVSLAEAQRIGLDGRPLATAIVTEGTPEIPPTGFTMLSNGDVERDLERPVRQAKQTIALIRWLLWAVAAGIIGAIVYLSVLERLSDFAVLKAIGVSTRTLVAGLVLQAVLLAAAAAALAIGLEAAMAPASELAVEVPLSTFISLPLVAATIGTLASLVALRRAIVVDPALAFNP